MPTHYVFSSSDIFTDFAQHVQQSRAKGDRDVILLSTGIGDVQELCLRFDVGRNV